MLTLLENLPDDMFAEFTYESNGKVIVKRARLKDIRHEIKKLKKIRL